MEGTDPALNVSAYAGACIHRIHTFRGQIVEDPAYLAFAQFRLDGCVLGQLNFDRDGQWFSDVNTENEGDGIYQNSVYAEDLAGNKGA